VPWLVHDGKVLATLEVATTRRDRMRGLLGRDHVEGALQLDPARSVHTIRMRIPIDVAFCDGDLRVLRVVTMRPNRVGAPVWKARSVIEAEAGSFERWGVVVGDRLEVRGGATPADGRGGATT
jgi:uncharacterized protein